MGLGFDLQAEAVTELQGSLLDGIEGRLKPQPERVCRYPGAIAWDTCDCAGMLAITTSRLYLTQTFPAEAQGTGSPCDGGDLAVELQVQVVRCAPTPDEDGNPPTVEALHLAAAQLNADAWELRAGATCALRGLRRQREIEGYRVGAVTTIGPEGGCVAVALPLLVALDGTCPCDG